MQNLGSFTKKELEEIGDSILCKINIDLFNAEPTIHKAYQICNELIQEGYITNNKELTCHKIYHYFKKRSRKNQTNQFQEQFGLKLNDRLRSIFTLSFRTSVIEIETMRNVASALYSTLAQVKVIREYGITQNILFEAIQDAYKPRYYENEWMITTSQISRKINKILLLKNSGEYNESITELFNTMSPDLTVKVIEKARPDNPSIKNAASMYLKFNEQALAVNSIIKDSEIEFIKKTLDIINQDEITEKLDTSLYRNEKRHPKLTIFLMSIKEYNRIMSRKEGNMIEIISELKITVRSMRETGNDILEIHNNMLQERIDQLEQDLEIVV